MNAAFTFRTNKVVFIVLLGCLMATVATKNNLAIWTIVASPFQSFLRFRHSFSKSVGKNHWFHFFLHEAQTYNASGVICFHQSPSRCFTYSLSLFLAHSMSQPLPFMP